MFDVQCSMFRRESSPFQPLHPLRDPSCGGRAVGHPSIGVSPRPHFRRRRCIARCGRQTSLRDERSRIGSHPSLDRLGYRRMRLRRKGIRVRRWRKGRSTLGGSFSCPRAHAVEYVTTPWFHSENSAVRWKAVFDTSTSGMAPMPVLGIIRRLYHSITEVAASVQAKKETEAHTASPRPI